MQFRRKEQILPYKYGEKGKNATANLQKRQKSVIFAASL
jgi:hypothetical protein